MVARGASRRPMTAAPVRRHEVVEPLTAAIRELALTRAHFDRMINARERDLDDDPPATLAALEPMPKRRRRALVHLALEVLGAAIAGSGAAGSDMSGSPMHSPACCGPCRFSRGGDARYDPSRHRRRGSASTRGDYAAARGTPALRDAVAEIAASAEGHLQATRLRRAAIPRACPSGIAAGGRRGAHPDPLEAGRIRPVRPRACRRWTRCKAGGSRSPPCATDIEVSHRRWPDDEAPQVARDVFYLPWKSGRRRSAIALMPSSKSSVRRSQSCSTSSRSVAASIASTRPRRTVSRVDSDGERCGLRDFERQCLSGGAHLGLRHQQVGEADAHRFVAGDAAAGIEQERRLLRADEPRQGRGQAEARGESRAG